MTDMTKDEALKVVLSAANGAAGMLKSDGFPNDAARVDRAIKALSRPAPMPEDVEGLVGRLVKRASAVKRRQEKQAVSHKANPRYTAPDERITDLAHAADEAAELIGSMRDALRTQAAIIAELKAENERLRAQLNPPEMFCATCGRPQSNHPYRHPFKPFDPSKKEPK